VTPGTDAVIHEPGDAAGLAAAIHGLAIDPARRAALGRAARRTADARFDRRRLATELISVYQAVSAQCSAVSPTES
jgi:glycosyltransferase involved in cell wall biosynthesis